MPVSDDRAIVRLAAKGDGVTNDGSHFPRAVPGDLIDDDGTVIPGPHHVDPPCRHFDRCGGCQLQHADDEVLRTFVHDRIAGAARGQGAEVGEWLPTHLSPPHSRRRATLHAVRSKRGTLLGFREARSHAIVDLIECPVLDPVLTQLVAPLRKLVARYGGKGAIAATLSRCDQGVDVGLSNVELDGLEAHDAVLDFARSNPIARLTIDQGYGAETMWEPDPATVTMSGRKVPFPAGAFLQATPDAEAIMVADAKDWLSGSPKVADLFAGLGTFAFALTGSARAGAEGSPPKVAAIEADRRAHLACKAAAASGERVVFPLHRDLFRNPLQPDEVDNFEAVLLDPPRAGARAQIAAIAASNIRRVVYISCNPSSWARDAAVLIEAGFALEKVRPVGQFRWSNHVELTSLFTRL